MILKNSLQKAGGYKKTVIPVIQTDKRFSKGSYIYKNIIVPKIRSNYTFKDRLSDIRVRLGFKRMSYSIKPGLYAIGSPDENSDVIVTANYLLTINKIRKKLTDFNCWVIVLDTKGVNVWCAAGKGTFGTNELIKKISSSPIQKIIKHNTLILPQFGAVGIDAFEVQKKTGFKIKYGPVRIDDLVEYKNNNYKKDNKMKTVTFNFFERFEVTPLELIFSTKYLLSIIAVLTLFGIFKKDFQTVLNIGFIPVFSGVITGTILVPLMLPFIPFKFFSLKGVLLGFIVSFFLTLLIPQILLPLILITVPLSGFTAMNFTGSTPFTNVSGVKLEVKYFTPVFIVWLAAGIIFTIYKLFN